MKTFHYKAKQGPKKIVEGEMLAESREQVVSRLSASGLFPLEITSQDSQSGSPQQTSALSPGSGSASLRDKISFMDQLADLSSAGLSIMKALDVISNQPRNPVWGQVLEGIKRDIHSGKSFSESLEAHPAHFSLFMVSMIRAGETGGSFDVSLRQITQCLEREEELRSKIRQSLLYPGVILTFGLVTILILFLFVVPRLESLYEDFGGTLPFITQMVIGLSRALGSFWWLLALGVAGAAVILKQNAKAGRASWHSIGFKLPWLGAMLRMEENVHFLRTLGLLLKNGVSITEALTVAGNIAENPSLQNSIASVKRGVMQGDSLAHSLEKTGSFDALAIGFVQTGEETGTLDVTLDKVSRVYEKDIERKIKVLTTLLEPLMILAIGIIVGIIVISMLLPIFQISFLVH